MIPARTKRYVLQGLDCAACAAKIEEAVARETGWQEARVNFATGSIYLPPELVPAVQEILDRIEPGVRLIDPEPASGGAAAGQSPGGLAAAAVDAANGALPGAEEHVRAGAGPHRHGHDEAALDGRRLLRLLGAAALAGAGVVFRTFLSRTPYSLAEYAVFLAAYWLAGSRVLAAAARTVRRGAVFDENFLMTVATLGAILIGELPEAVSVMLFYSAGEALQDMAVNRSRRSIRELLDIRPDRAYVRRAGRIVAADPAEVAVGEEIVVRPGEKIPLDGEVIEGRSRVDTSALTGEPVPRRVAPGDPVLAGMVNAGGLLAVRVTRPFAESSVARILELVEHAGARKAKTERFITTFSRYYTPAVVLAALSLALLPPLLVPGAEASQWIYRALVLLVISCPCALVLSIPVGYFGGIGGASRQGILVKGANFLDALAELDTVVVDKTGTLTEGTFKVRRIEALDGFSESDVLEYAALAESFSNHPIAASILEAYGKLVDGRRVEEYEEIPGHGVIARVDQKTVAAGNDRLLHREGIPHECGLAEGTVVYVAVDGKLAGRILIADEIKPDAREAVESLKRLGVRRIVMLSGDSEPAARQVAALLGIDEVYAGLLPEEKVERLEALARERKNAKGKIAFVGDGINDAPALVRADVGIAMGALGSDASVEAADVVIMDDMPSKVARAVAVAKRTRAIVWQNIAIALGVKAVFIVLGAWGAASLWEAVFADVGVSLVAVANAARALRAPKPAAREN